MIKRKEATNFLFKKNDRKRERGEGGKVETGPITSQYLGATNGRVAGRVTDGKFILNGEEFRLAQNSGRNAVHGGIEVIKIACKDMAAREVLCFIAKHFFSSSGF